MSDDDLMCDVPGCDALATMWKRTGEHMNRCPRHKPSARNILQDLIAELQDASTGYDPDCQSGCGDIPGAGCPVHYEEAVERAADRAEARLREVQGE